jgi:hypothetical protein
MSDSDNDSESSRSSDSGSFEDDSGRDAPIPAPTLVPVPAPTKTKAPAKKAKAPGAAAAMVDDKETKAQLLLTRNVLVMAAHDQGCNVAGEVPGQANEFLVEALRYYAKNAQATFSAAPTNSGCVHLKPTLVEAFLRQFQLEPRRRVEVATSSRDACAFMFEAAIDICKAQERKTMSKGDMLLAARQTLKVMKGRGASIPSVSAPASASSSSDPAPAKKKKRKAAVLSHAVAPTADAPIVVSGDVPTKAKPKKPKKKQAAAPTAAAMVDA